MMYVLGGEEWLVGVDVDPVQMRRISDGCIVTVWRLDKPGIIRVLPLNSGRYDIELTAGTVVIRYPSSGAYEQRPDGNTNGFIAITDAHTKDVQDD